MPGSGSDQVPPVQLDLSLWQGLRADPQGKMNLTEPATGSYSWVTSPWCGWRKQLPHTQQTAEIQCSEGRLES